MAKALIRGIIEYRAINIRDFAFDKHSTCDDAPYGGGAGMLMLAEPLGLALESVGAINRIKPPVAETADVYVNVCSHKPEPSGVYTNVCSHKPEPSGVYANVCSHKCEPSDVCTNVNAHKPEPSDVYTNVCSHKREPSDVNTNVCSHKPTSKPRIIYLSPAGRPFNQAIARELAAEKELILICGRYEGIDQRIVDAYVDDEISVGDYVLSSGDVAALALIDATYRLIDDVITPASLEEESFNRGLLEYPQYTRPEIYYTLKVPEVLLSGHHENIRRWRLEKRVEKTLKLRPDLIRLGEELRLFDDETRKIIEKKRQKNGEGE
jgi:tRNA (guanine-N1)-methyltransferase